MSKNNFFVEISEDNGYVWLLMCKHLLYWPNIGTTIDKLTSLLFHLHVLVLDYVESRSDTELSLVSLLTITIERIKNKTKIIKNNKFVCQIICFRGFDMWLLLNKPDKRPVIWVAYEVKSNIVEYEFSQNRWMCVLFEETVFVFVNV